MQHNQPAENENIFSDERVLLRPMDYGQSLVCRKPTDLAKVIGWFIVCFAAYAILISLVSLATGIPPSKVAGLGRSGTEPSTGSQSPRIVLGREPSAGSDSPHCLGTSGKRNGASCRLSLTDLWCAHPGICR